MVYGLWFVVCGFWFPVCGCEFMVQGLGREEPGRVRALVIRRAQVASPADRTIQFEPL